MADEATTSVVPSGMSGAKARAAARVRFQSGRSRSSGAAVAFPAAGRAGKEAGERAAGIAYFLFQRGHFERLLFLKPRQQKHLLGVLAQRSLRPLPRGVPPFREGRGVPRRKDRPGRVPRPVSARESRLRRRGMRVRSRQRQAAAAAGGHGMSGDQAESGLPGRPGHRLRQPSRDGRNSA